MKKSLLRSFSIITSLLLLFTSFGFTYQADIDPSFDIGTPVGFDDRVYVMKTQNDGKIIAGGSFSSYQGTSANNIIRLNPDGSRDTSFNVGSGFEGAIMAIAIQDDGKIIVGGGFSSYQGISANKIIRLNSDGSFDNSFTPDSGGASASVYSIAVQDDGKIIVGGNFTNYKGVYSINRIMRLNTDGSRDASFNIGAGFNNDVNDLIIQDDGNIIVSGKFTSYQGIAANKIIRLNSDGSRDTFFNIGTGFNNDVNDLIIQDDGMLIIGGKFTNYQGQTKNRIIRLTSTGAIDTSFNIGNGFDNEVHLLTINDDGKIVVEGFFSTYNNTNTNKIILINSDGSRDTSFDISINEELSLYYQSIRSLEKTIDNKIIVGAEFISEGGNSLYKIIKFNSDGSFDNSLNMGNGLNGLIKAIAVQDDGKIIVGGDFTSYRGISANKIIRLNPDGSRDTSFDMGLGFNDIYTNIKDIVIQDDGKIIVGGGFGFYNGNSVGPVIRLNTDGSLDQTFDAGYDFRDTETIAIQDDGKIIVGGFYREKGIARLNSDGSLDQTFDIGIGFESIYDEWNEGAYIQTIVIQNDGKIVVGGDFTHFNGTVENAIIRLNSDGSKDLSLNVGDGFIGSLKSILIQDDGKIIAGGYFTHFNGISTNSLIRLNSDGSKDASFNIGTGFDSYVNAILIQDDGKIIAGGDFTSYQGINTKKLVRINNNGSIDTTFNINNGFESYNDTINNVNKLNNGKIIVGGKFNIYKGFPSSSIVNLYGFSEIVTMPNSTDTGTILNEFISKGYTQSNGDLSGSTAISFNATNGLVPFPLSLKNNDIKLSLPQNLQLKKNDNITNYDGIITAPIKKTLLSLNNKQVLSSFSVGSNSESIKLTNGIASISVPTNQGNQGDPVNIYYSENNGVTWGFHNTANITDGYVNFTTDHFTDFAITYEGSTVTGSFTINNDATSTASQEVTLNIDAPGATLMRFSNTSGTNRSGWVTYSTTYPWTLSEGYGSKTVYAQFDIDSEIFDVSDSILYADGNGTQGNITLTITGGVTECVYGTSLDMNAQDVKIGIPYTFSGTFPSAWYCQDYRGIDGGWTLTIQTTDLTNEKSNVISGSNLLISHDPVVVEGDLACTGDNGTATQFYSAPYVIFAKASESNKICKVSADNVGLLVNVPANQAPGSYSGTLTLTMNGF